MGQMLKDIYLETYLIYKGTLMSYKIYTLTAQKFQELKNELRRLSTDERKRLADELDWVREISNIREDTAYIATLEEKNFLEKRIAELKEILQNCEVMNTENQAKLNIKEKAVSIGSRVKVAFSSYNDEFTIVSAIEADPMNKKISDQSPVGQALLGAREGDNVRVVTETVEQDYHILAIG